MKNIIEVKNLVKQYKELKAIDDLSFEVHEGEILGLLGPNGSGKSTTINCILSLLKFNKGNIKIFEKEMKPDSYDIKSKIGVVFQDVAVFKTFWKILNKNKMMVIFYTVLLIGFAASNMQTSEKNMSFVANKPDVLIVNNDEEKGITKDIIKYITDNSNINEVETEEEKINDALFYRDVNYVVYIPENYNKDFMDGKNPEIKIKSTGDYQASFEEMIVSRYIKVANIYQKSIKDEEELIKK